MALPPIIAYLAVRRQLATSISTKRPGKHLIRGILGCVVMALNFTALAHLSVGVATALSYLTPILAMCAAMVLLKERISTLVMLGVIAGSQLGSHLTRRLQTQRLILIFFVVLTYLGLSMIFDAFGISLRG